MKFDDLDQLMRVFETAHDHAVLPSIWMVARVDGRGFTGLTERLAFAKPFDERFRDHMLATTAHLMDCGFSVLYGYTQSDEISLLLARDEDAFGRKLRKLISILAGEASARFSLLVGQPAAFDCRISQLPSEELVIDYFRWRAEDAHRNALNTHAYWALRAEGLSARTASARLRGVSVAGKNELLFQRGVNFNDLPAWQKRGAGLRWIWEEREAINRYFNTPTTVRRRRLHTELELPMKDAYGAFVAGLLAPDGTA